MQRQHRRFSLDHTLLVGLNVIVVLGGAAALYHWVTFAEMAGVAPSEAVIRHVPVVASTPTSAHTTPDAS